MHFIGIFFLLFLCGPLEIGLVVIYAVTFAVHLCGNPARLK